MSEHCKDCCCTQSWLALGVMEYDGRSIPQHIDALRAEVARLNAELAWHTRPLDERDAAIACLDVALSDAGFTPETLLDADAAIIRVRQGKTDLAGISQKWSGDDQTD